MTELEQSILETLLAVEGRVSLMKNSDAKPDLLPLFERLEALRGQLPPSTHPRLRHYLERQSYEKARLWLQGRDPENQPHA